MKIVIPTNTKGGLDDKIAEHFGRCLTYTFLNEKGEVIEIIDNTSSQVGGTTAVVLGLIPLAIAVSLLAAVFILVRPYYAQQQ